MIVKEVKALKNGNTINLYRCTWPNCGHEFELEVGKGKGVSTSVICPRCTNGLPTWK